ncbi:MAG: VanZ family protein [Erysipelothrix sp.]|jgi:VanZ family protein|nr:VanZ family protein [Erysipelothrix sp.]
MSWTRRPHPLHIITTLVWVIFIFSFSLESAQSSSLASSRLAQFLYELVHSVFTTSPLTLQDFVVLVRKTAHVVNFAILMILVLRLTYDKLKNWKIGSWLFCLFIAITDETIQMFVPGRSSQLSDVILDMSGATIIFILFILFSERKKYAKNT